MTSYHMSGTEIAAKKAVAAKSVAPKNPTKKPVPKKGNLAAGPKRFNQIAMQAGMRNPRLKRQSEEL